MRFLLLFKSCGEFLYFRFSRQFSVSGCKFQPAFCGLWSQYKFGFQAFAVLLRSVPCRGMILSHASILRVCDQIHMRETWDAPRSPQTALCSCFPMLLPLSGLLRTLLFSLLSKILGLYYHTSCILATTMTVRGAAGRWGEGAQWTLVPPSSGSVPLAGGEGAPPLAFRYPGAPAFTTVSPTTVG